MKSIDLTYGGNVTITKPFDAEGEVGPYGYRVFYDETPAGRAFIMDVKRDETRPGKPELWMECRMDAPFYVEVERLLQAQIDAEHQAMVHAFDEDERRRA